MASYVLNSKIIGWDVILMLSAKHVLKLFVLLEAILSKVPTSGDVLYFTKITPKSATALLQTKDQIGYFIQFFQFITAIEAMNSPKVNPTEQTIVSLRSRNFSALEFLSSMILCKSAESR